MGPNRFGQGYLKGFLCRPRGSTWTPKVCRTIASKRCWAMGLKQGLKVITNTILGAPY